jgi:molybdopterin molybdotransferase
MPKIKIISTGNELVPIHQTPLSHQIRQSNSVALQASLKEFGYTHVDVDHIHDDLNLLHQHYLSNIKNYDVLIYTGGVSKGKYDYLPELWLEMGVKKHFHQVRQSPGKPLWFGTDEQNKTNILGLPGNPISCLVCLHRYFLPNRVCYARLAHDFVFAKDLTLFLPVKIEMLENGFLLAHPIRLQNSGEFAGLAESDGFIELPRTQNQFKAEESFRFYPWRPW